MTSQNNEIRQLQERVDFLQESNRWHMFALELMSSMADMHGSSNQSRDPQAILEMTELFVKRMLDLDLMAFMLVNEHDATFELMRTAPADQQALAQLEVNHLVNSGEFAWAINQNRPIAVSSKTLGRPVLLHVLASKNRVRGMFLGIPPQGGQALSPAKLNLLSVVMHSCSYALESAALYRMISDQNKDLEALVQRRTRELEYRLGHDGLTGLPNRVLFLDRLKYSISRYHRNKQGFAVLLLDLDMFKRINDTLGHAAGDNLLKSVAQRLMNSLRRSDSITRGEFEDQEITISRLGGDEFSMLINDLVKVENISIVVQRVIETLTRPFSIMGHEVYMTPSIGIVVYPNDGATPDELIKHADIAMYHAKRQGGNNFQFYSQDLNTVAFQQLMLENRMRHGIEHQEFLLHYQPKIDLETGQIIGAEALVRWQRPEGGLVPPYDFIPLAEESGLIIPLGHWILRTACKQAKEWMDMGHDTMCMAVNISPRQFRDKNLMSKLQQALEESGLPPHCLELELTEGIIMEDVEKNIQTLQSIHELGVKLSIDDFGTGYSSLNYLKKFPIDTLKIDQSFVRDITTDKDDAAIVAAIVAMAHSLHINVIAEGVETEDHVTFLRQLRCVQAQGYFFSKPLPTLEYLNFMKRATRNPPG